MRKNGSISPKVVWPCEKTKWEIGGQEKTRANTYWGKYDRISPKVDPNGLAENLALDITVFCLIHVADPI